MTSLAAQQVSSEETGKLRDALAAANAQSEQRFAAMASEIEKLLQRLSKADSALAEQQEKSMQQVQVGRVADCYASLIAISSPQGRLRVPLKLPRSRFPPLRTSDFHSSSADNASLSPCGTSIHSSNSPGFPFRPLESTVVAPPPPLLSSVANSCLCAPSAGRAAPQCVRNARKAQVSSSRARDPNTQQQTADP